MVLKCPHLGVPVAKSRILASIGGVIRLPVPGKPILTSANTSWEGFALEQHYTPPFMEFPENIRFPGYMIAMNACDEAALLVYRADGGGEKKRASQTVRCPCCLRRKLSEPASMVRAWFFLSPSKIRTLRMTNALRAGAGAAAPRTRLAKTTATIRIIRRII